jgi:pectin methylesterase-like acyl-CoA thioesterase
MKHQTLICFIAIQAFICAGTLLGVEPAIAGAVDDVAVGHAQAAMYVVDQAAPGAADTNPGTEEQPFKTVQHAADAAQPGDTVYVMSGKYDERVKVKSGGTEGKPVAFVAMPRRSVTARGFDLEASYIRVEGFEITADEPAAATRTRAWHANPATNNITARQRLHMI